MFPSDLTFLFVTLIGVAVAIINISFAIGVITDASRMLQRERRTKLVPALMWGFATLIGGVFVATAYWFIHHSSLSDRD